ncbi:MAG: ABC transporter ATP-binding protein [Planctomycetota bacterium]|nr:ABC transporter ATP-binding protein [Planctomycetota bacterium]
MTPVIELEQLVKNYHLEGQTVRVLKHIDLQIFENDFVAIMGPSGSGKTTLMNILGCLDTPTSGTYRLSGHEVDRLNRNELARIRNQEIGFVFQAFNLLPNTSAIRNVELPMIYAQRSKSERREMALGLLEYVGLGDRIKHRPHQLSGGQKQRVAIARALANDPSLILADEPTGNIDSLTGEKILNLLEDLHDEGRTIVLVTHEEAVGSRARRLIRIRDGQIESDEQQGSRQEMVAG